MANYWDIIKKAVSGAVGNAVGAVPQAGISLAGGLAQKQASQFRRTGCQGRCRRCDW